MLNVTHVTQEMEKAMGYSKQCFVLISKLFFTWNKKKCIYISATLYCWHFLFNGTDPESRMMISSITFEERFSWKHCKKDFKAIRVAPLTMVCCQQATFYWVRS